MSHEIKRAAVIGGGWMGASIAALLTSAGIDTILLDVLPPMEPSVEEDPGGLNRFSEEWRNSRAISAIKRALRHGAYLNEEAATRTRVGNIVDHLDKVADVDWVIEAVPEVLGVKRATYDRIEPLLKPGTLISSNTSGIRVSDLLEGRDESFRRHFFVSHFFNPVRHMRLVELVPGNDSDPALMRDLAEFISHTLGKGIIVARDTPYFIANRMGLFALLTSMSYAERMGISVAECDRLTGPAMARPGSATFRTADLIGLDALQLVFDNLHGSLAGDPFRENFNAPAFFRMMVERRWWGDKVGMGFYRRSLEDENATDVLDLQSLTYRPPAPRAFASLDAALAHADPKERLKALIEGDDAGSAYAWAVIRDVLSYAALLLGQVASEPVDFDRAMRWGYAWELGPFEMWDALGVEAVVARMRAEGMEPPPNVGALIESGAKSWYHREDGNIRQFIPDKGREVEVVPERGVVDLEGLRSIGAVAIKEEGFELMDLGDSIAALIIHPGRDENFCTGEWLDSGIRRMLDSAPGLGFRGIVIASQAQDFCPGMNWRWLLDAIDSGDWDVVEQRVERRQKLHLDLKTCGYPVVAALGGRSFGSGFELAMHCGLILTHAEAQIVFNEIGFGLIPAGGGCSAMLSRAMETVPADGPLPIVAHVFDLILNQRLARGFYAARRAGYLRKADRLTMDRERLIGEARDMVKGMLRSGFGQPPAVVFNLPGKGGQTQLMLTMQQRYHMGLIDSHDFVVGEKLAYVLSGGDVSPADRVGEKQIMELEREAFCSLAGLPETRRRLKRHFSES